MSSFDVQQLRGHFPALAGTGQVYLDNAGGSQILKEAVDSISSYLLESNVQLGASYDVSVQSTKRYSAGIEATAKYMHTTSDCIVLGPSTTQLFRNLSLALYDHVTPGSQIIISKLDHEANIASWVALAEMRGAEVVWWDAEDKKNPQLDVAVLNKLLTPKTKLVVCTHTSNVLGTINDVKSIATAVHKIPGALLGVDAVAYAPHAVVDVTDWGVDFYCFSWYKVYGPHIAAMYVSKTTQPKLKSLGHFFKPKKTLEDLLGLASASYELCAAIPSVCTYLSKLSWADIAEQEEKLQAILIDYLNSKPDVYQIYGQPTPDRTKRVPVISFTVKGVSSRAVVEAIEAESNYGCRWGSFYSNRLTGEVLGLDPVDGVVRASFVHYNTEKEISGFVQVLDKVVKTLTQSKA